MHTSANQGIDKQNNPGVGGGGGAYDKVKEDKYCRGTTDCRNRNLIKRINNIEP